MLRIGIIVAGFAMALLAIGVYQHSVPRTPGGSFYRITVDLMHKGEPIHVDVVVACQLTLSRAPAGSVSVDNLNSHPYAYAMPIQGGHAVAVRTNTRSCETQATTDNGQIPANWLPLVVWYERAEDLSFGLGYLTQDAYESPLAQLEFRGAAVTKATWADYQTFERDRPKNLLPEHTIYSATRPAPPLPRDTAALVEEPWRAWRYSNGAYCHGVQRIPLTQRQKEIVQALRPENSQKFWTVPLADQRALHKTLFRSFDKNDEYKIYYNILNKTHNYNFQTYDRTTDKHQSTTYLDEMSTRDDLRRYRPQVFPTKNNWGLSSIRKTLSEHQPPEYELTIGDGQQLRGFVYCNHSVPEALWNLLDKDWAFRNTMGDTPSEHWTKQSKPPPPNRTKCKIDDKYMDDTPLRHTRNTLNVCWNMQDIEFQDDDFALVEMFGIGL